MNEERQYSDIEILEDAIASLGQIRLPVDTMEEAIMPIQRVRNNLKALLEAVKKNQHAEPEVSFSEMTPAEVEEISGQGNVQ